MIPTAHSETVTQKLINESSFAYNSSLLIQEGVSGINNFTCSAVLGDTTLTQSIIIQGFAIYAVIHKFSSTLLGPTAPPQNVEVHILSADSVSVSWASPVDDEEVKEFIIREINGFVDETRIQGNNFPAILSGLTRGMTYTFVVHAFIDIASPASNSTSILFDGESANMHSRPLTTLFNAVPSQVTSLHVDLSSRTVTWVLPQDSSDVTMYQLQYTPLCSNDTLNIDHDNTTNTSIDLPDIDQTVPYTITVKAVNNIGPGQQKNITIKRIDTESKRNFVSIAIFNLVYSSC